MTKSGSPGLSDALSARETSLAFCVKPLVGLSSFLKRKSSSLCCLIVLSTCVRVAFASAGSRFRDSLLDLPVFPPERFPLPRYDLLQSVGLLLLLFGIRDHPHERPPCMFKNAFASRPIPNALLTLKTGRLAFLCTTTLHHRHLKLPTPRGIVKDCTAVPEG